MNFCAPTLFEAMICLNYLEMFMNTTYCKRTFLLFTLKDWNDSFM